jgi:hypothetical protein
MINNSYNTKENREKYISYLTSCLDSGSIELIMSIEEFLFGVYKQELDEYYDWLYTTYVVNKETYHEEIRDY